MDTLASLITYLWQALNPATAILTGAALVILFYWGKGVTERMTKATLDIQKVASTIADDKGNPILSYQALSDIKEQLALLRDDFEEHANGATSHYADTSNLSKQEHWQNCPVNRCPNLPNITAKLDHIIHIFDTWDDKAEESRRNTGALLSEIQAMIRDCSNDLKNLAKTFIEVLSNAVSGNSKKRPPQ